MVATNAFPTQTTGGQGLFSGASSVGLIVGQGEPDPSARFRLTGGIVSQNETIPMYQGVGVYALVPPISTTGPVTPLGPSLGRATSLDTTTSFPLAGFCVSDQSYNGVTDPQSTVPLIGSGQSANYYPLGSKARLSVACDPSLISLRNTPDNATNAVSWDFTAQMLIPYSATYPTTTITGATWDSTSGGQTTFTVGSDLTADINAGDDIEVTGVISTGGTGVGYNGQHTVVSVSSTTIVVSQPSASSPGTYSSGGQVVGGGGSLNVRILRVEPTNCMVPVYNPVTNTATWNFNGSAALIQLI